MQAEIITIGDEILIGQITDTNSPWIGNKLNEAGIRIHSVTSVGDDTKDITEAIERALGRSEVVITTGGIGPTKDDITKNTLAAIFGCELVLHQKSYEMIGEMLKKRGVDFNGLNRSQAMIPSCCTVLPNYNGTAPGMWFERGDSVLVSMPGVPFEMKELMTGQVIPRLKEHFKLSDNIHSTLLTFGLPEAVLAEKISEWEDALPYFLHLAYLPSPLGIRLRLSAYEVNGVDVNAEIGKQFGLLEKLIPDNIVGYGETSLERETGMLLLSRKETVAAAESCTGGNIARRFTANPGASEYFKGGVVSYSNELKISLLGVRPQTIGQFGAVSSQTACEMAEGMRKVAGTTYAIATTGIAGPGGGSDDKPVGTVWIALATPDKTVSEKFVFGQLRAQNIERASSNAIDMLRLYLKGLK